MITLKLISILFVLNNIYYILNYKRLDEPFKMRDKNSKLDLIYYFVKALYPVFLIIGFFTDIYTYFIILSSLILLRIPIHFISKRFSLVYHRLIPPFTIIALLFLLIKG